MFLKKKDPVLLNQYLVLLANSDRDPNPDSDPNRYGNSGSDVKFRNLTDQTRKPQHFNLC
jgi:hypothetical protein